MTISEQFTLTQKSGLDLLFHASFKALEGMERIAVLNAQAVKATLAEAQAFVESASSTRDASELVQLHTSYVQPVPQKMKSYWDHVSTILLDTQSQVVNTTDSELGKYQADARSFVEGLVSGQFNPAQASSAWSNAFLAGASEAGQAAEHTETKIVESTQDLAKATSDATHQVIASSDPSNNA